jgi:uncharacterized C2H2 Zn-finger protein
MFQNVICHWCFSELGLWSDRHYSRSLNIGKINIFEPLEETLQDTRLNQHGELQQPPDLTQVFGLLQPTSARRHYVTKHQLPNEGFVCKRCGKIYRWKKSLYNHVKLECGKEPQFQCPHCPHRAKLNWNLQKHIRLKHPYENVSLH